MRTLTPRSLSARTLVFSGAFALALVAAFAVLVLAIRAQRSAGQLALRSQQAVSAGESLEKTVLSMDNGLRGFVVTGSPRSLAPFRAGRRAYPHQLDALGQLVAGEHRERVLLGRIRTEIGDYVTLWALPLIGVANQRPASARSIVRNTTGRQRIDGIRADFARLFAHEQSVAAARETGAAHRSQLAVLLGVGGIVVVLALTVALVLYLRRSVVRPIEKVADATQAVAAGELSTRVAIDRADEIGTLARGFDAMTDSLQRNRAELEQRTGELERSNRDLEDFAAIVSHDLQAPLVTISMFADALGRRIEPDSEEGQLVEHIRTATGDQRAMVRDLLAYSRLGRAHADARAVPLDEVVERALDNLAGPIDAARARVVAESLPVVSGDAGRLCQMMQNLVGNAVKFSNGTAPLVQIRSATLEGRCRVSIADNGIGFDPEHAARIFRPFARLHSTDSYEGSGIGLAICERIATQHGGRIWADGRKGAGATFHVELPLAEA